MKDNHKAEPEDNGSSGKERVLSPAAQRALAEAQARRAEIDARAKLPKELNGRKGPEPVRYGDWEKNGLTSDF